MQQIKCPHCGEVFTIDESNYNSIVKQIRDHEFSEELSKRTEELQKSYEYRLEAVKAEAKNETDEKLRAMDAQLSDLNHQLETARSQSEQASAIAVAQEKEKLSETISQLETEMAVLKNQIDSREKEAELVLEKKLAELSEQKNAEIQEFRLKLESQQNEYRSQEALLKAGYEEQINAREAEIEHQKELVQQYKDFKLRQSTKMVGESLEQHCAYEFNRVRMGMFPNAYFEKDNDAKTGSKGDFIFKESDEEGNELISIMFEMKNENETTATKHKNEDFFKELDKDRNEKHCEYAILVSMLELDNDLYNDGIVDVSYRYPKMYVIRPQFFIPMITLLRNAALNTMSYKHQLTLERNNNLDITHFEENMEDFKKKFGRNYELAARRFKEAIEDIDKTIRDLEKTKAALISSEDNLRLANNKAQDLTIKKLTRNAPSLREKFEELHNESE
ncbi:MAG: DUF2130 domain-containing protein [Solobacterium sp.]|nr:DUF2130 domain-containing protein [Solobacterium sp.]